MLKKGNIYIFIFILFVSVPLKAQDSYVDLKELVNKYIEACKNGDADGCNSAASILFSFEMYKESFKLFKEGCDKLNNPISCYNLGDFFYNGYGSIQKDENKAIEYWKKSCQLSLKDKENYCGGCSALGNLFLNKKLYEDAINYYLLDCKKSCCEACIKIEDLFKNNLISKTKFTQIKNKNKSIFETCDFFKKLSNSNSIIEE